MSFLNFSSSLLWALPPSPLSPSLTTPHANQTCSHPSTLTRLNPSVSPIFPGRRTRILTAVYQAHCPELTQPSSPFFYLLKYIPGSLPRWGLSPLATPPPINLYSAFSCKFHLFMGRLSQCPPLELFTPTTPQLSVRGPVRSPRVGTVSLLWSPWNQAQSLAHTGAH